MINLILEIIKIIGWSSIVYLLFRYRPGVPLNIFYMMLLSSFLMIHSGVYDILLLEYSTKHIIWFPADVSVMVVYILWLEKYHALLKKVNKSITELIKKIEDE